MLFTSATNSFLRRAGWLPLLSLGLAGVVGSSIWVTAKAQSQGRQALTLRADLQQANAKTGVVLAKGNVQLSYPWQKVQATAAQAQYFSREQRIVLRGNVAIVQGDNRLQADTVTYFFDEGRFIATPLNRQQVEAVISIPSNPSIQSAD